MSRCRRSCRLEDVSLHWYRAMLAQPSFLNALQTSAIIAFVTMVFCLVFGSLAAYPLARLNVPHKNLFLTVSIVTRMVPAMILVIPMFLLLRNFRLLDSHLGLIIVYTTFLLPYVIWMLKNFFEQVPYALEAAARMDGCSRLGALWRVLIPVTAPGIVATAIFAFIGAWNEFLFGLDPLLQFRRAGDRAPLIAGEHVLSFRQFTDRRGGDVDADSAGVARLYPQPLHYSRVGGRH